MPPCPNAVPCPLCGRFTSRVLRRFTVDDAAQAFAPRRIDRDLHRRLRGHLHDLWHGGVCRLMHCESCDFGFCAPFTAGDATFYELSSPDSAYPKEKWEFARTAEVLAGLSRLGPSLLEIGAGKGHFLRQALAAGIPAERMLALEFSSAGREAIRKLGVQCLDRDIRNLDLPSRYEVVCMFQVLEHLDDYRGLFAALRRVTRTDAHLFIAVPAGVWIDQNEAEGLLIDMPPNHISRWSETALARLGAEFGWRVEQCLHEPPQVGVQMRRAFADRYVRLSQMGGNWASLMSWAAHRQRSRVARRLLKLAGAALSPSCWRASMRRALGSAKAETIWVHLRRDDAEAFKADVDVDHQPSPLRV